MSKLGRIRSKIRQFREQLHHHEDLEVPDITISAPLNSTLPAYPINPAPRAATPTPVIKRSSREKKSQQACPICFQEFPKQELENHVNQCIEQQSSIQFKNPLPDSEFPAFDFGDNGVDPNTLGPDRKLDSEHFESFVDSFDQPEDFKNEPCVSLTASQAELKANPFAVTCPYSNSCGFMEARNFPSHVYATHERASKQNLPCPICSLLSDPIQWPADHNLLKHLQENHADLIPSWEDEQQFSNDLNGLSLGKTFVEETLQADISEKECSICLDEFLAGNVIKRLDCWCIYHSVCIDAWFEKNDSCPLHKQTPGEV